MHIVDLTHMIEPAMPVYPGSMQPELHPVSTCERDGYKETLLEFYSHTGTHMDAPAHIFRDGLALDQLPADRFAGKALVIDCGGAGAGTILGMERLSGVRELADQAEFLLFRTGWDRFWGQEAYFDNYPVLGADVAEYLITSGKKGVGVDTISVDPMRDHRLTLHHRLLAGGSLVILENLTNLTAVGTGLFTLCALPLKYREADGAPVRAIGLLE